MASDADKSARILARAQKVERERHKAERRAAKAQAKVSPALKAGQHDADQ